jgi:hypothetical protein
MSLHREFTCGQRDDASNVPNSELENGGTDWEVGDPLGLGSRAIQTIASVNTLGF